MQTLFSRFRHLAQRSQLKRHKRVVLFRLQYIDSFKSLKAATELTKWLLSVKLRTVTKTNSGKKEKHNQVLWIMMFSLIHLACVDIYFPLIIIFVAQSSFDLSPESDSDLLRFCITMLSDWLKKPCATLSSNQKYTKTSRDSFAHVFPRFAFATRFYFEFWLVHKIVCVICDWPENPDVFPAVACLAGNTSACARYQREYFGFSFTTLRLKLLLVYFTRKEATSFVLTLLDYSPPSKLSMSSSSVSGSGTELVATGTYRSDPPGWGWRDCSSSVSSSIKGSLSCAPSLYKRRWV